MKPTLAAYIFLAVPLSLLLTACPPTSTSEETLQPPTGLTAKPGDGQVSLAWKASSAKGVAQYVIKLESQGDLSGDILVTAPATGTTVKQLANDKSYTFSIAVETKSKKRSKFSETITATPKAPPPSGGGDPKVATPTGLVLVAGNANVTATWNANGEADLKSYTLFWGTSPDTISESKTVDAPTTTVTVEALTNDTTYFFALEAQNSKGEQSARSLVETTTPSATVTQPVIENVTIEGYGSSLQVRQGAFFILNVTGQNLSNLTSATLGTLSANILPATSSTMLAFTVPHGQMPGFLNLSLTTGNGTATKNNAVEVSEISVAKSDKFKPSDSNPGTKERPFLTLTKALANSSAGDTILLGAGDYDVGETWPNATGLDNNVPDGVKLNGIAVNAVRLIGPGADSSSAALSFAGSATVRNLSISEFSYGILYVFPPEEQGYGGNIILENLDVSENYAGLYASNPSNVTVSNSSFVFNALPSGGVGLQLDGFGDATIQDTTFTSNSYGIYATSARSITLRNITVEQSEHDGLYIANINSSNFDGVSTSENTGNGLYLENIYESNLKGIKANENKGNGIFVDNSIPDFTLFKLEFSEISNNDQNGVVMVSGRDASWDLGIGTNGGGNNTFAGNAGWQLLDDREANTGVTVKAEGNIISGTFVTPGTYTAIMSAGLEQQVNGVKLWRINRIGNSITF